jgi:hypothetical protein
LDKYGLYGIVFHKKKTTFQEVENFWSPNFMFFGGRLEKARSKIKYYNVTRNGSELMCIE